MWMSVMLAIALCVIVHMFMYKLTLNTLHNIESAATLVHAFVSSHVDYCNTVFAGAPKFITVLQTGCNEC